MLGKLEQFGRKVGQEGESIEEKRIAKQSGNSSTINKWNGKSRN